MPFFSFSDGAAMFDATPIENMFLLEYLPGAPDECLRVYLYARVLALHPELGSDLAAMAQALHMEEDAVYEAFGYWERQGLVRRLTDRPPTYELLPVRGDALPSVNPMERDYYEFRDFNTALQALFPGTTLLHPQEFSAALDWIKLLGFDQDAVLLAVEHEVKSSRSKAPDPARLFKRLDRKMIRWADQGIRSAADLERTLKYAGEVEDTAQAVLKRFGLRRKASEDELDCVRRWLGEWGYTRDAVLDACGETTKARMPTFAYLDAVLSSRREGDGAFRDELAAALRELEGDGAQITPDLLSRYAALRGVGFEAETIRLAAVQCHRKRKTRFEDLEWMLDNWREQGLFTPDAAERYVRDMRRMTARVRQVLEKCGLERRPTLDDLERYERWQAQCDAEVIDYAATCARGMRVPVQYMDKLLSDWAGEGVRTVEAAQRRHEAARAEYSAEAQKAAGSGGAQPNPALNYEQRDYDDEDFGDDFFFDVVKAYGKEGEGK